MEDGGEALADIGLLGGCEAIVVVEEEAVTSDEGHPSLLLEMTHEGWGEVFLVERKLEGEVGFHEVEAADGKSVGHGRAVLAVVVTPVAGAHLAAVEVVEACGVVVGIEACGGVEGVLAMKGGARHVETMESPMVEAEGEGCAPVEGLAVEELLGESEIDLVVVAVVLDEVEDDTVGGGMLAEDVEGTLEGVGRKPVVGIEHLHILTHSMT